MFCEECITMRMFFNLTLTAVLVSGSSFGGPKDKISKDLESADPTQPIDVIVQLREAPTETHHWRIKEN